DGPIGMIRLPMGRTEEGDYPIAEELGHCASLFRDRRTCALEIVAVYDGERLRFYALGERRGPGDIAEQHRYFSRLTSQFRQCLGGQHLGDHGRWEKSLEAFLQ